MLKAQAMVETGGNEQDFLSDPLRVNATDWDPAKHTVAGLAQGQVMTPQTSADAALKWLQLKGWHHDADRQPDRYRGDAQALRDYNGNWRHQSKYTGNPLDTKQQRDWYAATVPQLARDAAKSRSVAPGT
jgi:hypothetical protein